MIPASVDKKSCVITWVATLPADDPQLILLDKLRRGEEIQPEEPLLSLKDVGRVLDKTPSWLTRLEVQRHCGHRQAGSLRYRVSEVRAFLTSEVCRARIAVLHTRRMTRGAPPKGGPNER